jgi:hypothetical protein
MNTILKRALGLALTSTLLIGVASISHAGAPKVVWKDSAGDVDPGATGAPLPSEAGFDLVSGSIARKGSNLIFSVKHAALPPIGSLPEAVRFMWAFSVGKTSYRVTVKRTEIGKPNPVTQENTDQVGQVYPDGFFRLEGGCGSTPAPAVLTFVDCKTVTYLKGTWNPASASFTFAVPMKAIKAKTGSKIGGGAGDSIGICAICWVTHVAERSLDTTTIDETAQTAIYKVPKK